MAWIAYNSRMALGRGARPECTRARCVQLRGGARVEPVAGVASDRGRVEPARRRSRIGSLVSGAAGTSGRGCLDALA